MYFTIALMLGCVTAIVGIAEGQATLGIGLASMTVMMGCAVDYLAKL